MNTNNTPQIDLNILEAALKRLGSNNPLISILSQEEKEQIELAPQLIGLLREIENLTLADKIGGFITQQEAMTKTCEYTKFLTELARLFPLAVRFLGPLLNLKPLGCSAEHAGKLLGRAQAGDFVQLSLGKTGDELNYLMAVVDKDAKLRVGVADQARSEAVGEDYLDEMRPCPPCT